MARKIIKLDSEQEEIMKKFIAGDIPEIPPEILPLDEKKNEEVPEDQNKPRKSRNADESEAEVEKSTEDEGRKNSSQRGTARKKKDEKEFERLFLVKRVHSDKRQTYISREIYNRMIRYLPQITNEISLTTYFDNVLLQHLEDYQDIIAEMFEKSIKKPI